jgi:hypothetical protein
VKQPAYHLRSNKAVDRLTLIDAIKGCARLVDDISEYTYYGFGGPYLEDFRLLYEFYPEIRMISIEDNDEIFKRQRFHAPCHATKLRLRKTEFKSFLARYEAGSEKSIFWLDYLDLKYGHFEDFMVLLEKVSPNSLIKISLRCEPSDYLDKDEAVASQRRKDFQRQFQEILPHPSDEPPTAFADFAKLLQDMVQISSQKALPGALPLKFVPISSFQYADGAGMFTLTGMVCRRPDEAKVKGVFRRWHLGNLNWSAPRIIDVPTLSTKERLHLQHRLPCNRNAGRVLRLALGYFIDNGARRTEAKLRQYADFHRYFPYFMKAVP